jgi:hypothetical protein
MDSWQMDQLLIRTLEDENRKLRTERAILAFAGVGLMIVSIIAGIFLK